MSGRERILLAVVALVAVVGGFWMLALSPKRAELAALDAQLLAAQTEVAGLEREAADAGEARRTHLADRRLLARLNRALPSDDATSQLLLQLDRAAGRSRVELVSISPGAPAATPTPGAAPSGSTLPPGVTELALQLSFEGRFPDLRRFLERIHATTSLRGEAVRVSGRLLSVQALRLDADGSSDGRVKATVTAAAYTAAPAAPAPAPGAPPATGAAPAAASAPAAPATQPAAIGVGG